MTDNLFHVMIRSAGTLDKDGIKGMKANVFKMIDCQIAAADKRLTPPAGRSQIDPTAGGDDPLGLMETVGAPKLDPEVQKKLMASCNKCMPAFGELYKKADATVVELGGKSDPLPEDWWKPVEQQGGAQPVPSPTPGPQPGPSPAPAPQPTPEPKGPPDFAKAINSAPSGTRLSLRVLREVEHDAGIMTVTALEPGKTYNGVIKGDEITIDTNYGKQTKSKSWFIKKIQEKGDDPCKIVDCANSTVTSGGQKMAFNDFLRAAG